MDQGRGIGGGRDGPGGDEFEGVLVGEGAQGGKRGKGGEVDMAGAGGERAGHSWVRCRSWIVVN